MKKEQILENSYNTYFTDSKYHDSPDKNFTEIYVLPAMDDFARQEVLEFNTYIFLNFYNQNESDLELQIDIGEFEYYYAPTKETMRIEDVYNHYLQSKQK